MNRNKEIVRNLQGKTIENRAVADVKGIDTKKRMIPFIMVSKNNAGLRYDWWENEIYEERLEPGGADFSSLNTFFKDHRKNVDSAIGRVENKRLESEELKADVFFGTDADSDKIYQKYREGILTDVSIGYTINEVITTERKDEPTEVLVTDFNIVELSAVGIGFDKSATIGREKEEAEKREKKEKAKREKKQKIKTKSVREAQVLINKNK